MGSRCSGQAGLPPVAISWTSLRSRALFRGGGLDPGPDGVHLLGLGPCLRGRRAWRSTGGEAGRGPRPPRRRLRGRASSARSCPSSSRSPCPRRSAAHRAGAAPPGARTPLRAGRLEEAEVAERARQHFDSLPLRPGSSVARAATSRSRSRCGYSSRASRTTRLFGRPSRCAASSRVRTARSRSLGTWRFSGTSPGQPGAWPWPRVSIYGYRVRAPARSYRGSAGRTDTTSASGSWTTTGRATVSAAHPGGTSRTGGRGRSSPTTPCIPCGRRWSATWWSSPPGPWSGGGTATGSTSPPRPAPGLARVTGPEGDRSRRPRSTSSGPDGRGSDRGGRGLRSPPGER